jgi:hypothetical protein|tara:strand:+ start:113 stop:349 length:237 start_codon:yes stop_codon:yes gene_type:complete
MSMRVRELQQYLGKFTNNEKGTVISDCPVYIETQDGHLEEIRRIELQENKIVGAPEPARLVFKTENIQRWRSITYKQS